MGSLQDLDYVIRNGFKFPVFFCKKVSDGEMKFKCPKCKETHFHGLGEGHRTSHCVNWKCWPHGYYVRFWTNRRLFYETGL